MLLYFCTAAAEALLLLVPPFFFFLFLRNIDEGSVEYEARRRERVARVERRDEGSRGDEVLVLKEEERGKGKK